MIAKKHKRNSRRGVTTVEFAMVAPVLFLVVFLILELARLMLFSGNVNTALLVGVRKATIASSTSAEVDELIRSELRRFGIDEAQISLTPTELTPEDRTVSIDIDVPISANNGLVLSQIGRQSVQRSIVSDREN